MKSALYSGSFDPPTLGHLDIIRRGAGIFGRLVLAVGVHHAKKAMFSSEERQEMLRVMAGPIARETGCAIEVVTFDGLVVEAARAAGCSAILRGIRNGTDLDYEEQMAAMNHAMAEEIDTVFLMASGPVRHIASSLVRQIAVMGGPIEGFVTGDVAARLMQKVMTP